MSTSPITIIDCYKLGTLGFIFEIDEDSLPDGRYHDYQDALGHAVRGAVREDLKRVIITSGLGRARKKSLETF